MTQFELDRLLFDDILSQEIAAAEHSVLEEILRAEGAETLQVRELLATALDAAPVAERRALVGAVLRRAGQDGLAEILDGWPADRLAGALIQGLFWDEIPGAPTTLARLRERVTGQVEMALRPAPNLMFTRDPCISLFDRVLVARMATEARSREPLLVRFALRYGLETPPTFVFASDDYGQHPLRRAIEGGDVLVLSPEVLLIGCSERTTPQTIERVATEALFPSFSHLQRVYAVIMPAARSVMHLDTVLTQVDHQLFLAHVPMIALGEGVHVARLERGREPALLDGATVQDVLTEELGPDLALVPCGGPDRLFQMREQWTDGANAVCVAPGRIILYSRNVRTNAALLEHGFEQIRLSAQDDGAARADRIAEGRSSARVVYTFTGAELSRARGGARCLTMPLVRD